MSDDTPWWEPPLAGSEAEHLLGSLDRLRATFRWKADGLDAAGLAHRIPSSSLSLGGLLQHLARVEDEKVTDWLYDAPVSEPWRSVDWKAEPHWEFESAATATPAALYELYDTTVRRARAVFAAAVAEHGLDMPTAVGSDTEKASLRRILFDLVEEYGRHTGHADMLREAVDGRVGEDPPGEFTWRV